jgi:hypothetical protein
LSSRQATPIIFPWPFVKGLSLFLPALILVPFLLLKPNRRAGAWVILLPFGLIAAVAWVGQLKSLSWLVRGFSAAYSYHSIAGQLIPPLRAGGSGAPYLNIILLASGLCVLCLMTYAIEAWSSVRKFVAALVLFVLPGVLTLFAFQAGDDINQWAVPLVYSVVPLILLVSFILAAKWCRKRWNLLLFSMLFFCWSFLFIYGLRLLNMGSMLIRYPSMRPQWWNMIPRVTSLYYWLGPAVLFGVVFPFILTVFLSPLFGNRLKAAFKVVRDPVDPGT